jgi:hypothetical protein
VNAKRFHQSNFINIGLSCGVAAGTSTLLGCSIANI